MAMNRGQRNHRITIQHRIDNKDNWGTPLPQAGEDVVKVWAEVVHQSGLGAIRAGAEISTVRASIRIGWRTGITAGMRALHAGQVYDIEAVLPGATRQHVDLVCKLVVGPTP